MMDGDGPTGPCKRTKTARAIQHSTLHLAATQSFESITIDMIAKEAGISRRTFFNHFKNKEEALVGPKVRHLGPEYAWFVESDDLLLPDLQRLVRQILVTARPDRVPIQNIGRILKASPDLRPLFSNLIDSSAFELAPLLQKRLNGNHEIASLLARTIAHVIALSFQGWTAGEDSSVEQVADSAVEKIDMLHSFMNS